MKLIAIQVLLQGGFSNLPTALYDS